MSWLAGKRLLYQPPMTAICAVGVWAISLMAISVTAIGQQVPAKLRNLTKLPPILVVVGPGTGLDTLVDENEVRTSVELKLRQNGLRVISQGDTITYPRARMYVQYDVAPIPGGMHAWGGQVSVFEYGVLTRNGQAVNGRIWDDGWLLGYYGSALKARDIILKNIGARIDAFVNDYLAANPVR